MKAEKKVDPRLAKAIKAGEKARRDAQAKENKKRVDEAEKERKRIASFSEQADEWVGKKLFKLIAAAEAEGRNRVQIVSSDIPEEALIKAIQKIDGLTVENVWVEDVNDPDVGLLFAAHYDYYVKWKPDPYEGYKY